MRFWRYKEGIQLAEGDRCFRLSRIDPHTIVLNEVNAEGAVVASYLRFTNRGLVAFQTSRTEIQNPPFEMELIGTNWEAKCSIQKRVTAQVLDQYPALDPYPWALWKNDVTPPEGVVMLTLRESTSTPEALIIRMKGSDGCPWSLFKLAPGEPIMPVQAAVNNGFLPHDDTDRVVCY